MADEGALEHTPTWVVASVCTVIVAISLGVERFLHYLGKVGFSQKPPQKKYQLLKKKLHIYPSKFKKLTPFVNFLLKLILNL